MGGTSTSQKLRLPAATERQQLLLLLGLALALALPCGAAALQGLGGAGATTTTSVIAAASTVDPNSITAHPNSTSVSASELQPPKIRQRWRAMQTENVIGYTSFEEPQTIVVWEWRGTNAYSMVHSPVFRRSVRGAGDVDPAPWAGLDPAEEHELLNGPDLSSVQFVDADGDLRTGCGDGWNVNSEGYNTARNCVDCCITNPQGEDDSCCSNGFNPLSYERCSNGQSELGFRAFYRPTTGAHGLSINSEVGVVDGTYMYFGTPSTMADGTQSYMLGNARRQPPLSYGADYPPADGFAYVVIDPVRVADYTSVEMSGWMHIDGGDANIDHGGGSWWSENDRLRVWAQDASDSASQPLAEVVLIDTDGQDLDDYDYDERNDAGYLGPVDLPYWYTRPMVRSSVTSPWAEVRATIDGIGEEVSMCFGLSVLVDGTEPGNHWDVHKLVLFDNFRLVGIGPDRSAALCASSACLPGTDYSGYVAGSVSECVECVAGTVDDDSDPATPCVNCLAGTYSDAPGATECTPCSPGSHSDIGVTACVECVAGTVDDDSDPATPCVNCLAGTYSDAPGATECFLGCQPGRYSPPSGGGSVTAQDVECVDCAAGTFDDDSDPATPCAHCPAGT